MRLEQVRNANKDELVVAIKHLCDTMQDITWGEFCAMKSTIEHRANDLGMTYATVNEIAEEYQVFGG